MSKHTPSPWAIDSVTDAELYIEGKHGQYIAEIKSNGGLEEAMANATLIAAAPESHEENVDSLACIKSLYADHPEIAGYYFGAAKVDRMEALIHKAEGRTKETK